MVFSFFKKDGKDPRQRSVRAGTGARKEPAVRPGAAQPRPAAIRGTPLDGAPPDREVARSLAMETAAKIDAIESEMARDFLRPTGQDTAAPITAAPPPMTGRPMVAAPAARTVDFAPDAAQDDFVGEDGGFDPGTDVLAGSVDAIEINTSGAGSIIDETAILFSNGQIDAAEAVLRAGIRADDLGHAAQNAWLMLFELINQRGDKRAFEQLTMEYALRFENSPPAWFDYLDTPVRVPRSTPRLPAASAAAAEPAVRLPEKVDASVVRSLEELKNLATTHAALRLDFSAVRSIDLVGAELLLRVVNAFKRARHELTLAGAEPFLGPLRSATEPGRRDASDALWMLLLETLRVLDRQEEFDETAIQYCITFEVSPPSWEPAPPNIRPGPPTAVEPALAFDAAVDMFEWRGVIEGEGEPYFGRMLAAAPTNPQLLVECAHLRRMAFSAASAMLSLARRVRKAGSAIELRDVNPMVAALLHLLGVTSLAEVQVRRG